MKKIILLSIFCVLTFSIFAQQNNYSWRIGAYGGYNFYQGDLNSDLDFFQVRQPLTDLPNTDWQGLLSYGGSLEYNFQKFGLKLLGTRGIFQANDRAVNRKGDFIAHSNFDRALNAQTELYDLSLLATFYGDNGRFLSRNALISPYFSIGFGGTYFDVFTNLTDANNRKYYYWSDGLIYDKPELSVPPDVTQLTQDETFETKATNLQNEGVAYPNLVWNVPLAIGVKFRISQRLNLNLEVMGRYVNSDYLDDVRQRGNAADKDVYGLTSLSLHYNFGRKNEDFVPPVFYSLGADSNTNTNTNTNTNSNSNSNANANSSSNTNAIEKEEVAPIAVNPKPNVNAEYIEPVVKKENLKVTTIAKEETAPITVNPKPNVNEEYIEPVVKKEKENLKVTTIAKEEAAPIAVNPKPNVNAEYIEPVVKKEKENLKVTTVIDTTKKVVIAKIETVPMAENPARNETVNAVENVATPTFLTNDKLFTAEKKTYLEVQKTRLEVAALNEQANVLLKNYDASKVDSFVILNQKIEALSQQLEDYQQYVIGLAIQGNAEYTKPENQAIEKQTSALEAETEALRQKYRVLVLGEADPKAIEKELAKIEAQKAAEAAKKAALEEEVKALESATIDNKTVIETTPSIPTRTAESIVTIPNTDTSNLEIRGLAGTSNLANTVLSDSAAQIVNAYQQELKALTDEVNRLNTVVIPQKNQTIDSLKTKVNYLEGELVGIKETNKYWADFFQKQIASLNAEITKLNQNQTAAMVAKPTVVEKIVTVPAVATTKTLQEVIDEFGVSNVYFDNGKTTVKPEFHSRLNRVAALMTQNPEIIVVLKGYTDKSGNPDLNFKLSKKRAEAVKTYLINQGVLAKNIDITYFGENQAAAVNDPLSRKVEVVLMLE